MRIGYTLLVFCLSAQAANLDSIPGIKKIACRDDLEYDVYCLMKREVTINKLIEIEKNSCIIGYNTRHSINFYQPPKKFFRDNDILTKFLETHTKTITSNSWRPHQLIKFEPGGRIHMKNGSVLVLDRVQIVFPNKDSNNKHHFTLDAQGESPKIQTPNSRFVYEENDEYKALKNIDIGNSDDDPYTEENPPENNNVRPRRPLQNKKSEKSTSQSWFKKCLNYCSCSRRRK